MNNKKGFTLVEITLSIVLVLMLALLVVPSLINYDGSAKEKLYESKVKIILDGAYSYGKDNIDILSESCTDVTVSNLIQMEYLEADDESQTQILNPIDNSSMNNLIICVTYSEGRVNTKVK